MGEGCPLPAYSDLEGHLNSTVRQDYFQYVVVLELNGFSASATYLLRPSPASPSSSALGVFVSIRLSCWSSFLLCFVLSLALHLLPLHPISVSFRQKKSLLFFCGSSYFLQLANKVLGQPSLLDTRVLWPFARCIVSQTGEGNVGLGCVLPRTGDSESFAGYW